MLGRNRQRNLGGSRDFRLPAEAADEGRRPASRGKQHESGHPRHVVLERPVARPALTRRQVVGIRGPHFQDRHEPLSDAMALQRIGRPIDGPAIERAVEMLQLGRRQRHGPLLAQLGLEGIARPKCTSPVPALTSSHIRRGRQPESSPRRDSRPAGSRRNAAATGGGVARRRRRRSCGASPSSTASRPTAPSCRARRRTSGPRSRDRGVGPARPYRGAIHDWRCTTRGSARRPAARPRDGAA